MFDISDYLELFVILVIVVVVICGTLFGIAAIITLMDKPYCAEMARLNPEMEFDYTFWTACKVKTENGKWVDASEYMQYYGDLHTLNIGEVGD